MERVKKKSFIHQVFIECLPGARCVGDTILSKTQPLLSGHMLDSWKREKEPVSGGSKCCAQTNTWKRKERKKSNKQVEKGVRECKHCF